MTLISVDYDQRLISPHCSGLDKPGLLIWPEGRGQSCWTWLIQDFLLTIISLRKIEVYSLIFALWVLWSSPYPIGFLDLALFYSDFFLLDSILSPWRRKWQPTPLCLENPADRGAWWAALHRVAQSWTRLKQFSMHACIGEENGNPLQCSCLENPRDRGAWWAAIYGVAQSRTWLKQLSSNSISPKAHGVSSPTQKILSLWHLSLPSFIRKYKRPWRIMEVPHSYYRKYHGRSVAAAAAKSLQSCPTLWDPIDGRPPGSPSVGFSRQEHWSGLPFPSPMHESEKWKWSRSVMSNS